MPTFLYEIPTESGGPVDRGEIDAEHEDDARRLLRVLYCTPALPLGTVLVEKATVEHRRAAETSAKLRQLHRVLNAHHQWLKTGQSGERADLTGLNLRGVDLARATLSRADLAGADLSEAVLREADLRDANLVRASLHGADLSGADLRDADLSDADLRDSNMTGVRLEGADLWRANLRGCTIAPATLHAALGCKSG